MAAETNRHYRVEVLTANLNRSRNCGLKKGASGPYLNPESLKEFAANIQLLTDSSYPKLIGVQECGKPWQEKLKSLYPEWSMFFLPSDVDDGDDCHDVGLLVSQHFQLVALHKELLFPEPGKSSQKLSWRMVLVATLELVDAPVAARGKITIGVFHAHDGRGNHACKNDKWKQSIATSAAKITAAKAKEDGSRNYVLTCDANLYAKEFMEAVVPVNFAGGVGVRRDFVFVKEGFEHEPIERALPVFDETDHPAGAIGVYTATPPMPKKREKERREPHAVVADAVVGGADVGAGADAGAAAPAEAQADEMVEAIAAAFADADAADGDALEVEKGTTIREMQAGLASFGSAISELLEGSRLGAARLVGGLSLAAQANLGNVVSLGEETVASGSAASGSAPSGSAPSGSSGQPSQSSDAAPNLRSAIRTRGGQFRGGEPQRFDHDQGGAEEKRPKKEDRREEGLDEDMQTEATAKGTEVGAGADAGAAAPAEARDDEMAGTIHPKAEPAAEANPNAEVRAMLDAAEALVHAAEAVGKSSISIDKETAASGSAASGSAAAASSDQPGRSSDAALNLLPAIRTRGGEIPCGEPHLFDHGQGGAEEKRPKREDRREESLDEETRTEATAAGTEVGPGADAGAAAPAKARGDTMAGTIHPEVGANPNAEALAMLEGRMDHDKYEYDLIGAPVKFVKTVGKSIRIDAGRQVLPLFPLATRPTPSPRPRSPDDSPSSRAGLTCFYILSDPIRPHGAPYPAHTALADAQGDDVWANGCPIYAGCFHCLGRGVNIPEAPPREGKGGAQIHQLLRPHQGGGTRDWCTRRSATHGIVPGGASSPVRFLQAHGSDESASL